MGTRAYATYIHCPAPFTCHSLVLFYLSKQEEAITDEEDDEKQPEQLIRVNYMHEGKRRPRCLPFRLVPCLLACPGCLHVSVPSSSESRIICIAFVACVGVCYASAGICDDRSWFCLPIYSDDSVGVLYGGTMCHEAN